MTQAYETQTELGHLSAGISGGATSIVLVSGEGANFDTDLPYDIMIGGDGGETVSLTAIATDTLTISATAGAWPEGTAVFMIATLSQPRTSGQLALLSDITGGGGGGTGDVVGPSSSINNRVAAFNGTTGKLLLDSGILYTDLVLGPASAVDQNIAIFSGTGGKLIADGGSTIAGLTSSILTSIASRRAVRLVTVAALPSYTRSTNTITATANGALSVDGVAVAVGDRILNRHGTGADRGIYTVTATGSGGAPYVLDRATDADASADFVTGMFVNVTDGSTRVGAAYYLSTTGAITLNTTTLTYDPLVPPRGSSTNVQFRDSTTGEQDGAANVTIDAGDLVVGEYTSAPPSAPAAGSKIFSLYRAGYNELVSIGRRGSVQRFAPHPLNDPGYWIFQAGSSVTFEAVGIAAPTAVFATSGSVTVAHTNYLTQQRRPRYTSNSAAAGNACGLRSGLASPPWFRSTNTGVGGWRVQAKFIIHQSRTNQRAFVGFHNSNSATILANDPSSFVDVAGFAVDAGQTNWRWITNDSSGSAASTDLGSTYDTTSNDTYLYVLTLNCTPGGGAIYYAAERYDTSGTLTFTDGVSTSDLPTSGTALNFYMLLGLGTTTGSAVSIEPISATFSTEY